LLRSEPTHLTDAEIPTLVGVSLAMSELRARIARVAPESVLVLLCGETGTGKEVVAQALHQCSDRLGELVAINCAAIPGGLAEGQLFGNTQGAFTGAQARQGAFRCADRGTLFLDEIGDMPLELQAKLLRVLEDRVVTPVGSDRALPVDVRIVAATHHNLETDVDKGTFRSDLHARLAQIQIDMPPLRARREDILLLLEHKSPGVARTLTPDLVQDLLLYDWPQNVREVRSVAERLRIDGVTDSLRERLRSRTAQPSVQIQAKGEEPDAHAPRSPEPRKTPRSYPLPIPSKEQLTALLRQHQGVVQYVAEELKCSRRQARRWMETCGLDPEKFRAPTS
jgi:transcriptional regulator with PAS, ATPase and Fis domain